VAARTGHRSPSCSTCCRERPTKGPTSVLHRRGHRDRRVDETDRCPQAGGGQCVRRARGARPVALFAGAVGVAAGEDARQGADGSRRRELRAGLDGRQAAGADGRAAFGATPRRFRVADPALVADLPTWPSSCAARSRPAPTASRSTSATWPGRPTSSNRRPVPGPPRPVARPGQQRRRALARPRPRWRSTPRSKLATLMCGYLFADRLAGSGVTVTAVPPRPGRHRHRRCDLPVAHGPAPADGPPVTAHPRTGCGIGRSPRHRPGAARRHRRPLPPPPGGPDPGGVPRPAAPGADMGGERAARVLVEPARPTPEAGGWER